MLSTLVLFFKVKWFLYSEERQIRRQYPFFAPCNRLFKKAYRFCNPFRISKRYLKQMGASDVHQYGETPLPALATIATHCGITSQDRVIELGCGRGRGCFFLHQWLGCQVTGIDWVPRFISKAQKIHKTQGGNLLFLCQDFLKADFSGATVIYLFGTCLEDSVILELITRFKTLSSKVKIITISYPLSDYDSSFQTSAEFSVEFPWGRGNVFLNSCIC